MKENILVIGGTGKTGRRVVEILEELGHNVVIGSRNGEPPFDWDDLDTYPKVLKNIDRAYIVYYPDLAIPGAKDSIEKFTEHALSAGLDKVVLLSGKGEKEAEACEQIVANSGLNYTLVRASWFNQNFSEGAFVDFVLSGQMALPLEDARIPFVDANDIAEVVSTVLLDNSYNGKTLTITGPRKMTFKEVSESISMALGRKIEYIPISIDDFKESMRSAGLPDTYVWLFGYLFEEVLGDPTNQEIHDDVEKVLGRKATDFNSYVQDVISSGVWNPQTTI